MAGSAIVGLALFSATAALLPNAFLSGCVVGAGLASTAAMLTVWVMQATGTSPQIMGDLAEQWTASELRRMQRKGWRLVNHFSLRKGDIDHLLVGSGGAFVVETKWSSKPWTVDPPEGRVIDAVEQAERNARDVRLWARLPTVQPLVFLWGIDANQLPPISRINTAIVVAGPHAALWRTRVTGTPLSADQVAATLQKVDKQIRRRDPHDESLTELPRRPRSAWPSRRCLPWPSPALASTPARSYSDFPLRSTGVGLRVSR